MKITDDRGKQVNMPEISFAPLRSRDPFVSLVGLRAETERKSGPRVAFRESLGLAFVSMKFLVIGVFIIWIAWPIAIITIALGAALFLAGVTRRLTIRNEIRRSERRFREIWAEHPACLGCGYDLRDAPAQPDGCTVCTECGAAWQVESAGGGQ